MYIRACFKSQSLVRSVTAHVFLPYYDGYEGNHPPFRTLYFLPGYSADAEDLVTLLPLRRFATEHNVAIVIPDGENSFYTDHPERCTLYSAYVGRELVDVTRRMFPQLSQKRQDTYIGGISMGGYGAAVNALRFHDTFSKAVLFSPAIDPAALLLGEGASLPGDLFTAWLGDADTYRDSWRNPEHALLTLRQQGQPLPDLFLCCGRQDNVVYPACKAFAAFAEREHIPLTYVEGDGIHDLWFWDEMLAPVFRFLDA